MNTRDGSSMDLGERMNYITGIHKRIQEVRDNQEEILWYMQLKGWEGKRRNKDEVGVGSRGVKERSRSG